MEWIELGELGEVLSGYAFKSKKYVNKGIRVIRITNVQNGYLEDDDPKYYSEEDIEGLERYLLLEDDILISLTGNVGRVAKLEKKFLPAALNQRVACVRANTRISDEYLYYMLNSNYFENKCTSQSKGVAQKNLGITNLKKIKIPVPSMEIQEKIVKVLDQAQALIDKRKEQIEALDQLMESIFHTMFGNPVRNEKGWELKKLGELGTLGRGISKHRPRDDKILYGNEYPFIQTGDVARSGLYLTNYSNMYSKMGLEQSKLWEKGTLCITIAANIAKTSILGIDACFPDSIVGFIANENSNVIYVKTWFEFLQKIIEQKAPQSAQKNINLKILNELEIITPSNSLQNEFAQKVEVIEKQKEVLGESLELMEENYKSIMDKAFKGQLFN